jgi:hypothetical protein
MTIHAPEGDPLVFVMLICPQSYVPSATEIVSPGIAAEYAVLREANVLTVLFSATAPRERRRDDTAIRQILILPDTILFFMDNREGSIETLFFPNLKGRIRLWIPLPDGPTNSQR